MGPTLSPRGGPGKAGGPDFLVVLRFDLVGPIFEFEASIGVHLGPPDAMALSKVLLHRRGVTWAGVKFGQPSGGSCCQLFSQEWGLARLGGADFLVVLELDQVGRIVEIGDLRT